MSDPPPRGGSASLRGRGQASGRGQAATRGATAGRGGAAGGGSPGSPAGARLGSLKQPRVPAAGSVAVKTEPTEGDAAAPPAPKMARPKFVPKIPPKPTAPPPEPEPALEQPPEQRRAETGGRGRGRGGPGDRGRGRGRHHEATASGPWAQGPARPVAKPMGSGFGGGSRGGFGGGFGGGGGGGGGGPSSGGGSKGGMWDDEVPPIKREDQMDLDMALKAKQRDLRLQNELRQRQLMMLKEPKPDSDDDDDGAEVKDESEEDFGLMVAKEVVEDSRTDPFSNMLFVQLPPVVPKVLNVVANDPDAQLDGQDGAMDEDLDIREVSRHKERPQHIPLDKFEGHCGKLLVHKSGRITLRLNSGLEFDVKKGARSNFPQEVVSMDAGLVDEKSPIKAEPGDDFSNLPRHGTAIVLGHIKRRLVASPDVNSLLSEMNV